MKAKLAKAYLDYPETELYYYKHEGIWYLNIPGCGLASLAGHAVTENAGGTITVTPSILTTGYVNGVKVTKHGYLTNSEWVDC